MGISNIYEEYAVLESQIKALELKKEQLRPHILQMMIDNGETKVETAVGSFSRGVRKVWTYTEKVEELNEALKARKALEESTGDAELEEVEQLRFTMAKL